MTKNLNLKKHLDVPYKAFTIDDVFDAEECQELINLSENIGYRSLQTSKHGEEWEDEALRTNDCASITDVDLAVLLFNRIRKNLPASSCGLNPLIRFGRFKGNQSVQPHVDGTLNEETLVSKQTVVVYLRDVARGGETRFLNAFNMKHVDVVPKAGRVLVFDQYLCHAALPVQGSAVKYTMRSDVMYPVVS
jgi:hypothetical protein